MSNLSLDVCDLEIKFKGEIRETIAIEGVSFQLPRGKTLVGGSHLLGVSHGPKWPAASAKLA